MSVVFQSVRGRRLSALVAPLFAVFLSACCCPPPPRAPGTAFAAACAVASSPAPSALTVAVTEPVDFARAPRPRNSAERFVFAQLYETLVAIDCTGTLRLGLGSWSRSDDGRVWQFRLQPAATFWDGTPVTAATIVSAWSSNPRAAALFTSVTAQSANTLRVELQQPAVSPELFAHPELAIVLSDHANRWPLGTGPFKPVEANADLVRLVSSDGRRTIDVRSFPDARRALDANVDVLASGDAVVLDYARALAGYTLTALPWSRTYALVTRGENADTVAVPPDALSSLARDAVRADARPAEPPFWWRAAQCAPPGLAAAPANPTRSRIVAYPRGDAFARALAERIVALAWPAARAPAWLSSALPPAATASPPTASALNPGTQLAALNNGNALALVLPLPRGAGRACPAHFSTDSLASVLAAGAYRITPLLDARSYLIQRANVGTVLLDGDGTLRFGLREP